MIKGRQRSYHGVLQIPEGKAGKFEVRHFQKPAGECFGLSTSRTALLGGDAPGRVRYDVPTTWHELLEKEQRWMSDLPIEQAQHDRELAPMRGVVLVGGLGLGYAATVLALRRSVTRVVAVEKSGDVIALVEPFLLQGQPGARAKLKVIHADLFAYLKETTEHFAWGFFDIWTHDGEGTFFEVVCPLRALATGKVVQLVCWNENVMRGQLFHSLHGRCQALTHPGFLPSGKLPSVEELATKKGNIWHDWTVLFFQWVRDQKPSERLLERGVRLYVELYGRTGSWELLWGLAMTQMLSGK